jgi:hypothetical protein
LYSCHHQQQQQLHSPGRTLAFFKSFSHSTLFSQALPISLSRKPDVLVHTIPPSYFSLPILSFASGLASYNYIFVWHPVLFSLLILIYIVNLAYLLRALRPIMYLGLFYNCSPLVPVLWLSSSISDVHSLNIFFSWFQQVCLLVEYARAFVELISCKGSAPAFWKGVPTNSTALNWKFLLLCCPLSYRAPKMLLKSSLPNRIQPIMPAGNIVHSQPGKYFRLFVSVCLRSRSGYDSCSSEEDMSDESAVDETPPKTRGRKSINKGRWSKDEVSMNIRLKTCAVSMHVQTCVL